MSGRLWDELGSTMRRVRGEAGVSLRELESRGTWRRSTLSQVETGKARPSRELVEWYDLQVGSDGLLLSIYAEARSRQLIPQPGDEPARGRDVVRLIDLDPPAGQLVVRGAVVRARLTLANGGRTTWRGRRLRRMGARSGLRLIGSDLEVPVPDLVAGDLAEVEVALRAPQIPGSVAAYWNLVDAAGRDCARSSPPIGVVLLVV
jgi:transcriptional regulator with XRE-family HTH domain